MQKSKVRSVQIYLNSALLRATNSILEAKPPPHFSKVVYTLVCRLKSQLVFVYS